MCLHVHAALCASVCACIRGVVSHRHTHVLVRKQVSIFGGGEREGEGVPGALEIGHGVVDSGVTLPRPPPLHPEPGPGPLRGHRALSTAWGPSHSLGPWRQSTEPTREPLKVTQLGGG